MKTKVIWDGFPVRLRPVKGCGRIVLTCAPSGPVGGILVARRHGATLARGGGWRPKGVAEELPLGVTIRVVTVERGGRREQLADNPAWGEPLPDLVGSSWILPAAMRCDRLEVVVEVDRTAASPRWWLESLLLAPLPGQRMVAGVRAVGDVPEVLVDEVRNPRRPSDLSWRSRELAAGLQRRRAPVAPAEASLESVEPTAVRPRRRVVRPAAPLGVDRSPTARGHLRLVEDT